MKNTPAWCEQKWCKTAAIFPLESNPRSSLLTSVSVLFTCTLFKKGSRKPIRYVTRDDSLSRPKQATFPPTANRSLGGKMAYVPEPNERFRRRLRLPQYAGSCRSLLSYALGRKIEDRIFQGTLWSKANGPFRSCFEPHYESEANCKVFNLL